MRAAGDPHHQPAVLEELKDEARWRGLWKTRNCSALDTGNMEVLTLFGTAEHKQRYLRPLLEGTIRSAFAMTEPAAAAG